MARLPFEKDDLPTERTPLKKTVVYILSTPYAGSHFLSLLLGSHSRMMHLGEIKKLGIKNELPNGRLSCWTCDPQDACPVFRGLTEERVDEVYDILFLNCGSGTSVLIDASKSIPWAMRFGYDFKLIHPIRDPRALARRWLLQEKASCVHRWRVAWRMPLHALPILRGEDAQFFLFKWLLQNRTITSFLRKCAIDSMVVTYRDLALETARTIRDVVEWIGLEYEPSQLEHWNFVHHGGVKRAYDWVREEKTTYFDLRWKSYLSEAQIELIAASGPLQAYLKSIHVTLTDDGLTRHAKSEP